MVTVIEFSKQHLRFICNDAFEDERLDLVIADGVDHVERTNERYDVVALDVSDTRSDGVKVDGVVTCDLSDPNRDAYRAHFRGADAIIHSAFVSARGLDATTWSNNSEAKFRAEYANVGMAYNVYQTALEEGVKRVVVASSNHAADYYERLIWADRMDGVARNRGSQNADRKDFHQHRRDRQQIHRPVPW